MIEFLKSEKFRDFVIKSSKYALLALIFVSILILNLSTLLSPDDYNYSFVLGSGEPRNKVDTIADCIATSNYLYNNWTGGLLPHVLVGLFRSMNHYVFEIVNTIVFMIMLICANKVLSKKMTFLGIITSFGYLVFSMMFGEKFAWMSGALNYLWPTTCMVIFIYFMYKYTMDERELSKLGKVSIVLFSFITAFTHENVSFVAGSFLLCLYLFNIKKIWKKDKIFYILTFIMFCLGAAATIFAPGNFTRMNHESTAFSWGFLGNYGLYKKHLIIMVILMIIVFILKEKELVKKEILYFILPAIIATLPMAVISYFPPRAFLPYEILFIMIVSCNIGVIAKRFEKYYGVIAVISVALVLVVFRRYAPSTLGQIRYILPYKMELTRALEEAAERGDKHALVPSFKYMEWIHREHYINIDNFFVEWNADMPINRMTAMYYGFDKVTAIGTDEYLVQFTVDTEGIHPYFVIDRETGIQQKMMEYANVIEYTIPKDQLGNFVLNCQVNDVEDQILDYKVQAIGEEPLSKEKVSVDDLIIK